MGRIGANDVLRLEEQRAALSITLEQERETFNRQLEEHKVKVHSEGQAAVIELERTRDGLSRQVAALEGRRKDLEAAIESRQRKHAAKLDKDLQDNRAKVESERQAASIKLERDLANLRHNIEELEARKRDLRATLVADEEAIMLQEVGLYKSRHPLTDAAAYQKHLDGLRFDMKQMNKNGGGAIQAATNWEVNGSLAKGRVMVSETSKLMLRAYNAEAENLVRAMKPFKLEASIERLNRVAAVIARLGKTMNIRSRRGTTGSASRNWNSLPTT